MTQSTEERPPQGAARGVADRCAALTGWRRIGTAFLFGATTVLALPPVGFVPALVVGLGGLVLLLCGTRTWRQAAGVGWAHGFGFFLPGLYWTANSMLTAGGSFLYMLPLAAVVLPAGLALFSALAALLARLCAGRDGGIGGWALAVGIGWWLTEWLRGWILTGFPWNALGYAWTAFEAPVQVAAWGGVGMLSVLALAVGLAPVTALAGGARRWLPTAAVGGALFLVWGAGLHRLAAPLDDPAAPLVRVVQPNVPQPEKWLPEKRIHHIETLLRLSVQDTTPARRPSLIVWPETSVPVLIDRADWVVQAIASVLDDDQVVVFGTVRSGGAAPAGGRPDLYNAVWAVTGAGEVVGRYDKRQLVPFGEYLPLRPLAERLGLAAVATAGDFSAGDNPGHLTLGAFGAAVPLICYEAIFPHLAETAADVAPRVLLNLTNDAWFGDSPGPRQHAAMSRVRAIEQGLPMLRSANTGISFATDAYGRVVDRIPLGHQGVIDVRLQQPSKASPLLAWIEALLPVVFVGLFFIKISYSRRNK